MLRGLSVTAMSPTETDETISDDTWDVDTGVCPVEHQLQCIPWAPEWRTVYDTIRDAVFTCAQKLTRVSLIYRTEPTTKKWKNRKSKKRICREVLVNSPGNPWSQSRRRKGRQRWEGFAEKEVCITYDGWNMKVLVFLTF